jgi:hypothetical protein
MILKLLRWTLLWIIVGSVIFGIVWGIESVSDYGWAQMWSNKP